MTRNAQSKPAKSRAQSRETATVPLKQIIADIHRDNKNATITAKKARVALRKEFAKTHERNASWNFTRGQYDRIRAMFDPTYAQRVSRAAKRAAKTTPEPVAAE